MRDPVAAPRELAAMQEAFGRSIRMPFSFETGRFLCRKDAYDPDATAAMGERPLPLQPWLTVIREDWNLMENRIALGEGKPIFRKAVTCWAVYRNGERVEWEALDAGRYAVLSGLRDGLSLGDACMQALRQVGEGNAAVILDGQDGLAGWFTAWTRRGWFGAPSPETPVEG